MQPLYRQMETVEGKYVGPDGKASPWAMLRFAMNAAGKHSSLLSYNWETMREKGMFWAVIRHKIVISRYPDAGETVTVETWPMPATRTAYPRAVAAYDAQGKELFRLVSLWVLVDFNLRKMVLPGKSGIKVEGILRGNELELPSTVLPQELENSIHRTVAESDLDRNGHMNNVRYLVWALDVLPPDIRTRKPKEAVICYLSECHLGEEITLRWTLSPDGILLVDGYRQAPDVPGKTTRVFAAKMCF